MNPVDLEKIEAIIEPVAQSIGCELVSCDWVSELGRWILRVYIDRPGGVRVEDCKQLSYLLDPLLDVEEVVPQKYQLEISSPGLERPLRKLKDFIRFVGQKVDIKTQHPIGKRSHFKGKLLEVEEEILKLESQGSLISIPYSDIHRAHLLVDWAEVMKRKP